MNVIIERLNEVVFRVSIEGDITFGVKVRNQPAIIAETREYLNEYGGAQ